MKYIILIFTILLPLCLITACSGSGTKTLQLSSEFSSNADGTSSEDTELPYEESHNTNSTFAIYDSAAPISRDTSPSSEKSSNAANYTINASEINANFSKFQSALKNTSRQKQYIMNAEYTLKIGNVDILKILKEERTALSKSQQVYFTSVERIEKSVSSAPLGRSLNQTYFDGQTAYIRTLFEDSQSPENNYDNIITNPGGSAELEPVPYSYLNINKSYIIAADTTTYDNGSTEYAFTLDPEKSRELLANTLNSDDIGLDIDINDIDIEYNIINAMVAQDQNIISLSQTIKFSINSKTSAYINQYTYAGIGKNTEVRRPDWVK
ncbi:MAG TPA: hypothetical protein GXX17_01405 [Clostridiales bacterium]|nr:hypothetical protein [Clostridiales bacterium]